MIYIDGALARTPGLLCRRRRAAQRCRNVSGRGRQAPVGRSTHRHRDTETQIHTHTPNTDRDKRKHTRTHAQTHRRLGEAPGGLGTGPGELAGGSGRLRELREPNASSTEFYPESPRGSRKFPGARDRVRRACARLREALGDSAQGPRSFSRSLPEASGGSRTLPEAPGESGKGSGEAPGGSQKRGESGAWKYPQKSRKQIKMFETFPGTRCRDLPGRSGRLPKAGGCFSGSGKIWDGLRDAPKQAPGSSGTLRGACETSERLRDAPGFRKSLARFRKVPADFDSRRDATRDAAYDAIRRIYDAALHVNSFFTAGLRRDTTHLRRGLFPPEFSEIERNFWRISRNFP